jgi:hypothetical protein
MLGKNQKKSLIVFRRFGLGFEEFFMLTTYDADYADRVGNGERRRVFS